jgi:hypothetical protein
MAYPVIADSTFLLAPHRGYTWRSRMIGPFAPLLAAARGRRRSAR